MFSISLDFDVSKMTKPEVILFVFDLKTNLTARGFNGSVNIPESCGFRSEFDSLDIIFYPF